VLEPVATAEVTADNVPAVIDRPALDSSPVLSAIVTTTASQQRRSFNLLNAQIFLYKGYEDALAKKELYLNKVVVLSISDEPEICSTRPSS
jgi:hypothetical protein